jgi:ectoine hydroxylase-related dioxygenase (phytanoyl-CoA dioxygenase family)
VVRATLRTGEYGFENREVVVDHPYYYTPESLAEASIAYAKSGAICVKGAFSNNVEELRAGVDSVLREPGPFASEHSTSGRFFEDYCNWERIKQFRSFVLHSNAGDMAAALLSSPVQFFHDHVVVKSAGTSEPTPWHQDMSYFPVEAQKSASFWIALDHVDELACPKFVDGSHKLNVEFAPRSFDDGSVYSDATGDSKTEDIEAIVRRERLLSWSLEPGDFIAFHFKTLHGAPNKTLSNQRRAFVMRWVCHGSKYYSRHGIPPYPWLDLQSGQELPEERFPLFGSIL